MEERIIIIFFAIVFDLLFGDPVWFYHPVRLIGLFVRKSEGFFRSLFAKQLRIAGMVFTIAFSGLVLAIVSCLILITSSISLYAGMIMNVLLIGIALAINSLAKEGWVVRKYLKDGNIDQARKRVQTIVSRDLSNEDEQGIVRALLESMTENLSDGVIAPLFFAIIGGAPGIWFYKTVNTLDSMIGYRNDEYKDFGWFAARLDDVLNFIPARLTGGLIIVTSFLLGQHPIIGLRVWARDRKKGPSPNGGIPIITFAGARDIALGGDCIDQQGRTIQIPLVGGRKRTFGREEIAWALAFHYGVTLLFCLMIFSLYFT